VAVLRGTGGACVRVRLAWDRHRVVIVLYIQPLPVNPGVKDGTSARSIPVTLSGCFSITETASDLGEHEGRYPLIVNSKRLG
jgi:hypothetical protein